MTDYDPQHVRTVYARLVALGVKFGWRSFWTETGRDIGPRVRVEVMDPSSWDSELAPVWPADPVGRDGMILRAFRRLFSRCATFRAAIADAHCDAVAQDLMNEARDWDWGCE